MSKPIKELKDALDERIQYKMRNMKKLTKLYDNVTATQAKVDILDAQIAADNTEITVILNGMKDVANDIDSAMQKLSNHPDF